jgi:chemotaxis protein MotB
MARKRHHEEHANHEAWAIPYGDLVTLLLAFFVVMYAISSVNDGKYRVLSESLTAAFNGAPRSVDPVQVGIRTAGGRDAIDTGSLNRTALAGADASALARIPLPSAGAARVTETRLSEEQAAVLALAAAEQDARREQLATLATEVEEAMSQMIADGQLVVRRNDDWLEIDIRADTLFGSGAAVLGRSATEAIERLADVLRTGSNQIRVEGHTDNVPIRTAAFPSNWELSSARAAGVVRILAGRGVDPVRLSVLGLGEHRPRESNASAAGRLANRRVLLVIQPTVAPVPPDDEIPPPSNPAVAAALN